MKVEGGLQHNVVIDKKSALYAGLVILTVGVILKVVTAFIKTASNG